MTLFRAGGFRSSRFRSSRQRPGAGDAGFATVWAAGAVAVVLVVAAFGINLGAALVGRHRAEAAADLSALAAAGHAIDGELAACAHGARVTDGMAVRLVSCRVVGWEAFVETEVESPVPLIPGGVARGRARAGPIEVDDAAPLEVVPGS